MRSVNVAELKNRLSKYLRFAKAGEEIVIRNRNLPLAKLVTFSDEEGSEEELLLVAAGKMRLPKSPVEIDELLKIPTGRVRGKEGTQTLINDGMSPYEQASGLLGRERIGCLVCT